jgi:hypothetical protein
VANLTAQLTLDLSAVQTQWVAAKNVAKVVPDKIQAVQATIGGITVAGAPAGSTVAFTVSHASTDAALADLRTTVQSLLDGIDQTQLLLNAAAPVVTNVT